MGKLDKILRQNRATYAPNDWAGNSKNLIAGFLNKTLAMFDYANLPESIPSVELEKILQTQGAAFIYNYNDTLVALPITLDYTDVDVYGRALRGRVYLADLREYKEVELSDGVLIKNDFLALGLLDIFNRFSRLISESETTLYLANLWKRAEKVFIANDDQTAESVNKYLEKIKAGEIGTIISNLLYQSVNVATPQTQGTSLHDLIEYDNYIVAKFLKELGLYSNGNNKKERLITSEISTELSSIYPLVDNMLFCREEGIQEIYKKFGVFASVEFASAWLNSSDIIDNEDIKTDD